MKATLMIIGIILVLLSLVFVFAGIASGTAKFIIALVGVALIVWSIFVGGERMAHKM